MTTRSDDVLDALDQVVETLEDTCAEGSRAAAHAREIRERSRQGVPLRELLQSGDTQVVRQVSSVLKRLGEASSRLRRAQARALHAEGLTTERIAELFGVTRQRVSALLKQT